MGTTASKEKDVSPTADPTDEIQPVATEVQKGASTAVGTTAAQGTKSKPPVRGNQWPRPSQQQDPVRNLGSSQPCADPINVTLQIWRPPVPTCMPTQSMKASPNCLQLQPPQVHRLMDLCVSRTQIVSSLQELKGFMSAGAEITPVEETTPVKKAPPSPSTAALAPATPEQVVPEAVAPTAASSPSEIKSGPKTCHVMLSHTTHVYL